MEEIILGLYLVHDKDYSYRIVVCAENAEQAIEKVLKWLKETKQCEEFWISNRINWIADLCDNDKILE